VIEQSYLTLPLIQVITASGGAVNLTDSYCSVCTGYNLSYAVPLSPHLPDHHITLALEAAVSRSPLALEEAVSRSPLALEEAVSRSPLAHCSTPYRRGPCPASNEIDDDLPAATSSQHLVAARSPAASAGKLLQDIYFFRIYKF
jgi:hypothetical protein